MRTILRRIARNHTAQLLHATIFGALMGLATMALFAHWGLSAAICYTLAFTWAMPLGYMMNHFAYDPSVSSNPAVHE